MVNFQIFITMWDQIIIFHIIISPTQHVVELLLKITTTSSNYKYSHYIPIKIYTSRKKKQSKNEKPNSSTHSYHRHFSIKNRHFGIRNDSDRMGKERKNRKRNINKPKILLSRHGKRKLTISNPHCSSTNHY